MDSIAPQADFAGTEAVGRCVPQLPTEVMVMIASKLGDVRDLVACLAASRHFYGLDRTAIYGQKYACATLLSVCASGDDEGLRFVANQYGVPNGFEWGTCLLVAIAGGHTKVLDRIRAMSKAPPNAIIWSALLITAGALYGQDSAIASWLRRTENRPVSGPSSKGETMRCATCIGTRTLHTWINADIIVRALLCVQSLPKERQSVLVRWADDESGFCVAPIYYGVIGMSCAAPILYNRFAMYREAVTGPGERCQSAPRLDDPRVLEWIRLGHIDRLCAYLDTGDRVDCLGTRNEYLRKVFRAALDGGHVQQALQLYKRLNGLVAYNYQGRMWVRCMMAIHFAGIGRHDLIERIGWRPGKIDPDIAMHGRTHDGERRLWTEMVLRAARGGHVSTLEWMRDCVSDKTRCLAVCQAMLAGHLDVVAWLCAEGYNRSCRNVPLPSAMCAVTLLYWSIHTGRFDIAALLLDRTAGKRELQNDVDSRVCHAIIGAVEDALLGGDLGAVHWLHRREPRLVSDTAARLRSIASPALLYPPILLAPFSHYGIEID